MKRLQDPSKWMRLLTILIGVFVISMMGYYYVKSQYRIALVHEHNKLAVIAKHLEVNLDTTLMALQFLASDVEIKELDSEKIHNELVRPVEILNVFNAGVFDKQGKLVAEARNLTPVRDVQDWASFNEALQGHQIISNVIKSKIAHGSYISLRVPIYDDNVQVKAVLTADLLLDELAKLVEVERLCADHYIILKDNDNHIIYQPDNSELVNNIMDDDEDKIYIYNTLEKSNWHIIMVVPRKHFYETLVWKFMPRLALLCLILLCLGLLYRNLLQARFFEENMRRLRMERMRAVNQLAAGLAHEVRNPLTAIKGFLQLMTRKVDEVPNQNHVEIILTEIDRIDRLLGEFQMLTVPLKTLDFCQIDVEQMIDDVILLMEGQATNKNIKLTIVKPKIVISNEYIELMDNVVLRERYQIVGNEAQLKQVLINLLRNAIDAIVKNGVIDVTLFRQDKMVVMTIKDNGGGMSSDILSKIGTPFFTTKEGGNGVGLSVCYTIIEGHGGRIEVDSQVGKGTMFSVIIPSSK